MSHAYYQYNKEQLLKEPRLPLICMPDNATVFQAMAKEMFEEIEANNQAECLGDWERRFTFTRR